MRVHGWDLGLRFRAGACIWDPGLRSRVGVPAQDLGLQEGLGSASAPSLPSQGLPPHLSPPTPSRHLIQPPRPVLRTHWGRMSRPCSLDGVEAWELQPPMEDPPPSAIPWQGGDARAWSISPIPGDPSLGVQFRSLGTR